MVPGIVSLAAFLLTVRRGERRLIPQGNHFDPRRHMAKPQAMPTITTGSERPASGDTPSSQTPIENTNHTANHTAPRIPPNKPTRLFPALSPPRQVTTAEIANSRSNAKVILRACWQWLSPLRCCKAADDPRYRGQRKTRMEKALRLHRDSPRQAATRLVIYEIPISRLATRSRFFMAFSP
jgi:hypothetical protein